MHLSLACEREVLDLTPVLAGIQVHCPAVGEEEERLHAGVQYHRPHFFPEPPNFLQSNRGGISGNISSFELALCLQVHFTHCDQESEAEMPPIVVVGNKLDMEVLFTLNTNALSLSDCNRRSGLCRPRKDSNSPRSGRASSSRPRRRRARISTRPSPPSSGTCNCVCFSFVAHPFCSMMRARDKRQPAATTPASTPSGRGCIIL